MLRTALRPLWARRFTLPVPANANREPAEQPVLPYPFRRIGNHLPSCYNFVDGLLQLSVRPDISRQRDKRRGASN